MEIFDLDTGDALATYASEEAAVSAYELACQADADELRRLAVYEIDGTGHVRRTVRGPDV